MRLVFYFISINILYKVIFYLFVVSAFLLIPGLCEAQPEVATDSPPIEITEGWQYRWGDSPIDEKGVSLWSYDNIESKEWEPTWSTMNPPGHQGHKTLWLRVRLPEGQWKGPSLFIPYVFQIFEVYLEDKLIYKYGERKPSGKNRFAPFRWHIIPLEPDFHGKTLAFRIYSDSSQDIGIDGNVSLGSQANLIKIIMADIDQFILGFLFIFIGLFSVFIFLRRREQKVYFSLSFGAFVLCFGTAMLVQHTISQLLFDAPIVRYYLFTFAYYLFPAGLYASIEQVFGAGYKSIVRRIWQLNIVCAVGALILDLINVVPMPRAVLPFTVLVILEIPIAILSTSGANTKAPAKGNVEIKLFIVGFAVLAFPPVYDIFVGFGLLPAWRAISFHWGLFIFTLILGYILERRFAQAHKELEDYSRTLEQRVETRTQDLSKANEQIQALNEQLQDENLRLAAELEITERIQQMILPTAEELRAIADLEIAGYMQPADDVGGDYYDVFQREGTVAISIGDVTGHGLESGLVMLMTQTAVRALLKSGETDPVRFLDTLNRTIYDNVQRMDSDKNLTLCLLDYQSGELKLSGQHEEMIVVRSDGQVELVDTIDLGFPIGLDDDIADFIDQTTVQLQTGDGVVLYTDGITEAENEDGEQYGLERLCEVVSWNWAQSAEAIKEAVIADVREHIGEQEVYDDITLVVMKQK